MASYMAHNEVYLVGKTRPSANEQSLWAPAQISVSIC